MQCQNRFSHTKPHAVSVFDLCQAIFVCTASQIGTSAARQETFSCTDCGVPNLEMRLLWKLLAKLVVRGPQFWKWPERRWKSLCNYCVGPSWSHLRSHSRQDAVVLRRFCISHTRLTHSYLLNRQDQPECSHCDCALTVAHVLLDPAVNLLASNHRDICRQKVTYMLQFF